MIAVTAVLSAYADPVAQAEIERLREQIAEMVPRDWHGLMAILAEVYPPDVFPPGEDNPAADPGVRILSLIRHLDRLRGRVAELEAREQRVRWLADSFDPVDDTGYAHYAVAVDDEVILAVGLDDLRAALDGTQP
jgi:hypothetical protein